MNCITPTAAADYGDQQVENADEREDSFDTADNTCERKDNSALRRVEESEEVVERTQLREYKTDMEIIHSTVNVRTEGEVQEEGSALVLGSDGSKEQPEGVSCLPSKNERETSSRTSDSQDSYPGESATFRVLEVGCGVGNTVFPILSVNNDEGLFVYCCDFSSTAIGIVKESPDYNEKR